VDDSNSSGGANIIISSISFVEGALNGVTGVGGRELVVECDSSYKAEVSLCTQSCPVMASYVIDHISRHCFAR
jgi:hypothetical protein